MGDLDTFKDECRALVESGAYEAAKDLALQRLEAHPDDIEALLYLAEAGLHREDEGVLNSLERLSERMVTLARVFLLLGDIYLKNGWHDMARVSYNKFLVLDPESEAAAQIRISTGDASPDQATERSSSKEFRTITMAELLIGQGHLDSAKEILREITRREPGNAEALKRLSEITAGESRPDVRAVIAELERWRKRLAE